MEIKLTSRASEWAKVKSTPEAVMAMAAAELADLIENGLTSPAGLFFHTFEVNGIDFIMSPKDGTMMVDTCSFEAMDKLEAGPFKGQSPLVPIADSDDE